MIITEFPSRKVVFGTVRDITWEEFVDRLKKPVRTSETLEEYAALTNEQKTEVKDVGGYVAGEFTTGKRSKMLLKNRSVLTIDADQADAAYLEIMRELYDGVKYVVHSTHTSTKKDLRLRWLFPLARPVTAPEYRYLVGVVKEWIGEASIDETTDQPERLMFWPSISSDAEYIFEENNGDPLDPDSYLKGVDLEKYNDKPEPNLTTVIDGGLIPSGSRDNTLTRLAGVFQSAGLPDELCHEFLAKVNDTCCDTPIPDADVDRIFRSISKKPKGDLVRFQDRDEDLDFGDIGDSVRKNVARSVISISAAENGNDLLARYIPPAEFIIPGLIPVGLGMLIAPPKTGKSWFALDLAISVATGTSILSNDFVPKKGATLYLALEDYDGRIQNRTQKVIGNDENRRDLGLFYHAEIASTTESGLLDEMDKHLLRHPDTKLIIIDTLQKVRGRAKRTESAYEYDYRDLGAIQNFAITRQISVLVVHHTKKAVDKDEFLSNASGTNGISGVVDYGIGITRSKWDNNKAKLEITGRDIDAKTYVVMFDKQTSRWVSMGEEKDIRESEEDQAYRTDPFIRTILEELDQKEEELEGLLASDEPVTWEVSLQELFDLARARYGAVPVSSNNALSRHLQKFAYHLEHRDKVTFKSKHTQFGNIRVFSRPQTE